MTSLPASDALAFDCPRCGDPSQERFYGPCPSCRGELRRALRTEARTVGRAAFEPTMHVTPNAVALKE